MPCAILRSYPPPPRLSCTVGIIFSRNEAAPIDRVAVFLDYRNIYYLARSAFFSERDIANFYGQISPIKLAQLLIQKGAQERSQKGFRVRELVQVRVYTGIPNPDFDEEGFSRSRRQFSIWSNEDPRVSVMARELRCPTGWPKNHKESERPREKGVDIAIGSISRTMNKSATTRTIGNCLTEFHILTRQNVYLKPPSLSRGNHRTALAPRFLARLNKCKTVSSLRKTKAPRYSLEALVSNSTYRALIRH